MKAEGPDVRDWFPTKLAIALPQKFSVHKLHGTADGMEYNVRVILGNPLAVCQLLLLDPRLRNGFAYNFTEERDETTRERLFGSFKGSVWMEIAAVRLACRQSDDCRQLLLDTVAVC